MTYFWNSLCQAITYSGRDVDAMKAVAEASHKRSLADFQQGLKDYKKELAEDVIVQAHLGTLYDTMLEQNLCRIIEPYSRVQVSILVNTYVKCCLIHNSYSGFPRGREHTTTHATGGKETIPNDLGQKV